MTGPDELTTAEAAALARVSPRSIREWWQQNKIAGRKTAAGLVVERRSLEAHIRRRGEPPPSPSAASHATPFVTSATPDVTALVAALERSQAEALMLAGRVGWLEAQVQQREATILQLTAGAAEPAEVAADGADGAEGEPPWWARLRRWWERGGL